MSIEEWKSSSELGFSGYLYSNLGNVKKISTNRITKGSVLTGCKVYHLTNDDGKLKRIKPDFLINEFYGIVSEKEKDNYTWIPIPEFEEYKICEEGKILSKKGEIMKPKIEKDSLRIGFRINNKPYSNHRVCLLVATVFIPNPNKFKYVKFKDGDSMNVHKNNLMWSNNTSKVEDNTDEIWEQLTGFSKYQINPKGIRNTITHNILKTRKSADGYAMLSLFNDNNKIRTVYVHRLMAIQYIHNSDPDILIQVNHKNGLKDDFRIENLEWVTRSQNARHSIDTGLQSKFPGNGRKIELLDKNYNIICEFMNSNKAGKHVGCSGAMVRYHMNSNMLNDNITVINNYILRYKICIDLEGEIWKYVNTCYNNIDKRYKISNYGRIKNEKEQLLTSKINLAGYSKIILSNYSKEFSEDCKDCEFGEEDENYMKNNNISKSFYIHVLVAYAFLEFEGNRNDYQVNHKNKDPRNNNLDNLEILLTRDHVIKDLGKPVLCVTKTDKYYIFPSQSTSNYLPEMKGKSILSSIKKGTEYKDHFWYDLTSQKAQDIISEFQLRGITQSIPSKLEHKSEHEIKPKRKIRLIIVS